MKLGINKIIIYFKIFKTLKYQFKKILDLFSGFNLYNRVIL